MIRIRIKNFGPIKEGFTENDGWMEIKKVTLFIGNQGSGKSTVAKLISTFMWMEKTLNRNNTAIRKGSDVIDAISWHGLENYLKTNTEIEYEGELFTISYKPTNEIPWPVIKKRESGNYTVPKIMYISDQRNFLSTIKSAFDVTDLPGPLENLAIKIKKAQFELNGLKLDLPFPGFSYEYDERNDVSYVAGDDYKVNLLEASSGLQSAIPLVLVARNLSMQVAFEDVPSIAPVSANQSIRRDREISKIMQDKTLTTEIKIKKTDEVFARYHNKCFINIVEEPEQNLYPTSQKAMLDRLIEFNNTSPGNKLIMTTHSPYLVNYLTLSVEAGNVLKNINASGKSSELEPMVASIVPLNATVNGDELIIYEMGDADGTIHMLDSYEGLPSDANKLNEELGRGNELFAQLLEIQQLV